MRIFRLIAGPVILLGLLGVLIWGAMWGWRALTAPVPTPSPTPCVTRNVEVLSGSDVAVRIYNAGFTTGAAGKLRDSLEGRAFNVLGINNTDEKVTKVTIRANADQVGQVRLVTLQFEPGTFVVEYDDRIDGIIDILLPTDAVVMAATPAAQIAGGAVCVPPPKSASPTPAPSPSQEP